METVLLRFIFRAFEVEETCCDAEGRLQHWKWDTGVSVHPLLLCVCVFGHGQAQINRVYTGCVYRVGVWSKPLFVVVFVWISVNWV